MHGVDGAVLLAELDEAARRPASRETPAAPAAIDVIYRRYFAAGIAVVMTAGATWGALLLWTIGLGGSFRSVGVHAVNAHGEAQILGWVGLFVMGFAYQAFPRIWNVTLAAPRLAFAAFWAMIAGIAVRTAGMVSGAAWGPAVARAGGRGRGEDTTPAGGVRRGNREGTAPLRR